MATYNNKHWLLSHIRNSFISTDDTGLCEMVMLGEDFPRQLHHKYKEEKGNMEINADYFCYPGFEESDDEEADVLAHSYDLQFDMDFGHRMRSNTAQRLEKMDIAKKKAAKIKVIKWEDKEVSCLTDAEKQNFFEKKPIMTVERQNKYKSLFTEQLLSCADLPMNLFIQYGRVDGTAQFGVATKTFYIFLTMLPDEQRDYPLPVSVIATATIREFIGLICYKCSIANPKIPLKSVQYYALYITEDDGEVDSDFPSLDPTEPCSKFGFKYLGLVELKHPRADMIPPEEDAKFNSAEHKFTANEFNREPIKSMKAEVISEDLARMRGHTTAIEAPLYQSYRLFMLTAVRTKSEVQLGISGEKIEIDPVHQKKSKLWLRYPKAASYSMDSIASCETLEEKTNKTTFRITYSLSHNLLNCHSFDTSPSQLHHSPSFKHHDFETDPLTATSIVAKINNILEVHSSVSRREYLTVKDKRNSKSRRSFNLSHTLKF